MTKKKSPIVIKINKFFRRLLTAIKKNSIHKKEPKP